MTSIHNSTLTSLVLDTTPPATVSTTQAAISAGGFTVNSPVIEGTAGADTITSSTGALYVFGHDGDDRIISNGQAAVLLGGNGSDTFVLSPVAAAAAPDGSILDFENGSDRVDLSAFNISGFSELTITNNTDGVAGSFAQITNDAAGLSFTMTSTGGLDSLTADSFIFNGSATGSTGTTGGGTTDTGTTTTSGGTTGTGTTTVTITSLPVFEAPVFSELLASAGGQIIIGTGCTNLTLNGTSGNDLIQGATGEVAEQLLGGAGADNILGGAGVDTLFGGSQLVDPTDGADTLYGGQGNDILYGNGGNDLLVGGDGNVDTASGQDTLIGGAGDDFLLGNGDNDRLYGQSGNDTMHGGVGDDVFVFGYASGNDVIGGFEAGDALHILTNVNNSGITTAADVVANSTAVDGGVVVNLGNGNDISLLGVSSIGESQIEIITDLGL